MAMRVPTPDVSVVDLVVRLGREVEAQEVNDAFRRAGEGELAGIPSVAAEPLVSVDYTSCPYSAVVDPELTEVIDRRMVKVIAWYDNEMGFAHRLVDLADYIGGHA
jgi:glyceraldehyde 3-phosphate dehydrogenase